MAQDCSGPDNGEEEGWLAMLNLVKAFHGKGIKTRLLNPHDLYWDIKFGVNTIGFYPARGREGDIDWRLHYTPAPYSDIFRLLSMVNLDSRDVFVDLGSGLGRTVFAASWLGARKAIGVEIAPELHERASRNQQHSRVSNQNIEFVRANARDYEHNKTSVLFMFHPFGEETMKRVLRNLATVRRRLSGPELRILYMNPVFDHVLEQSGWLERIGFAPPFRRRLSNAPSYTTSLWRAPHSTS